ncbi:MAG: MFS transporter [Deltaproteobacteria bacterium RIFCSPLOWO2_02_FULL_50_16]|nr:MAG: MFS transporter [Deltaproteobacteria bacterium RIFCSPHIGHO2_02_FULL_50_15]OGQ56010.1 MAG: MFS transporter [Deltaproteobacteria bacterium RIFCSPLOWO2_02_FULL_50_16]
MSPLIIRSLKHRNFRLFFGGQTISLIGTWMTQVTTSWLVYRLTHSAFLLGLVGFTGQIPVFLFSAFAGVWIDRLNLRRILMVTQVLAMVQSLTLAFLTLTNRITVVEIIALGFFQGLINVFDMPTRQAFVVQMVDNKQDLGNAIALNSFMVNVARLIGPMLAGIIIAKMGEGTCFLIDGLSYIPVILSLLLMILPLHRPLIPPPGIFHQLKEGARYAFGFLPIRNVLFLMALLSLTGMSLNVLMPIFAVQIFNGDSHILGFLLSASGIGALVGAIVLASKKTVLGLTRIMVMTGCLLGVGMILFSFSRNFWLSLFSLGITGLCLIMIIASINTFLQTIVEDNKRGRLMSLFTIAFIGMAPFGSLLAGGLAKYLGAPYTLLINGSCCILGTLIFSRSLPSLRRLVKPIYIEKGIL